VNDSRLNACAAVADLVFIQRSRLGRSIFALRGETLELTSHLWGRKNELRFPLRSISADYDLQASRFPRVIALHLVLALVCFDATYRLLMAGTWPQILAMYSGIFGLMFLLAGLRFVRRVEYFIFRDHWKHPLFSILREREQTDECDAFVRELLDRIERAESGLPPDQSPSEPPKPVSAVRLPADDAHDPPLNHRWLLSLIAGVVSTVFPIATEPFVASPTALAVVIIFSTGGILAGWLSFAAKEPKRYWSLAGVLLSLVPIAFYTF
jgi:hypothetical protein